jgi:hypothetical protein
MSAELLDKIIAPDNRVRLQDYGTVSIVWHTPHDDESTTNTKQRIEVRIGCMDTSQPLLHFLPHNAVYYFKSNRGTPTSSLAPTSSGEHDEVQIRRRAPSPVTDSINENGEAIDNCRGLAD